MSRVAHTLREGAAPAAASRKATKPTGPESAITASAPVGRTRRAMASDSGWC
jgi:hypothetical protein